MEPSENPGRFTCDMSASSTAIPSVGIEAAGPRGIVDTHDDPPCHLYSRDKHRASTATQPSERAVTDPRTGPVCVTGVARSTIDSAEGGRALPHLGADDPGMSRIALKTDEAQIPESDHPRWLPRRPPMRLAGMSA